MHTEPCSLKDERLFCSRLSVALLAEGELVQDDDKRLAIRTDGPVNHCQGYPMLLLNRLCGPAVCSWAGDKQVTLIKKWCVVLEE